MSNFISTLLDRIALLYWVVRIYKYLGTCTQDNNAHDAGSIYLKTGIADLMMYDALSFLVRHHLADGPDPKGAKAKLPAFHHLWWYHRMPIKNAFFPPEEKPIEQRKFMFHAATREEEEALCVAINGILIEEEWGEVDPEYDYALHDGNV